MSVSTLNKLVLSFFVLLLFYASDSNAQCGFVPNQRVGCKGYQLNLQDTTTGSVNTNWSIRFSDGTTFSTTNNRQASRLMNICGRVRVTMTTTVGGVTCTKVDSNYQVNCPPVIRGTFSPQNVCVGQNVCFNNSTTFTAGCGPLRYFIDWGQSPLDTVPGCRKYTLAGTFNPSIIVLDACGCRSDTTFTVVNSIHVSPAPVASFTGSDLNSCATPLVSTMTASPGVSSTIFRWYINGSAAPAQSGHSNVFTNSYNTGTYSIKLITVDSITGCADTMTRQSYITVGNYPAACYTASISAGCAPKTVSYCSCSPGALSYVWDFPGGTPSSYTSSTNGCVNISYATPASYNSQLIVYYNGGCVDTLTRNNFVTIGQPYVLDFVSPDTFACVAPHTARLTYTGQPCAACTFAWNPPGNSTPASHTGTTVTLNSFQVYTPILTVTDPFGCASTLIKNNYIKVQRLKATATIAQVRNGCTNDTFLVANTTLGRPFASVTWSFPGGTVGYRGSDSAYVRYAAKGCHVFTMIVRTASGCVDTLRDSICVGSKPIVSLSITPRDVCYEEECNTFLAITAPGSDTPTSVLIWPEGLRSAVTTSLIDTPGRPLSYCYFYEDIGTFLPCFVAKNMGCVGDTVCLFSPTDTVHIYAPAAQFKTILSCSGSNAVTIINQSKFADTLIWTVDGIRYPDLDTLRVNLLGPCGTRHTVVLEARNFATGCVHSKTDTFTVPCTGIDFIADGNRKGCSSPGYTDSFRVVYTNPTVSRPSNFVWSVALFTPAPRFAPAQFTGDRIGTRLVTPGPYQFCVQLTYPEGCIDTMCKQAFVVVSKPTAAFTVSDTAGCSPVSVRFTNTSTYQYAPQTRFTWSFGDTSPIDGTTVNPTHIYTGVNAFIASLTVVDSNNCTSTATRQIVSNIVTADFATSDTITCRSNADPRNPLTFTNTSTGFVAHYEWTLPLALGPDNPTPGDVPSFTTRFTQEGTGDVCLIAIDQYNICSDTICKRITVRDPIADYTFRNLQDTFVLCPIVVVNPFIDTSKYDICQYYWDFGDGSHFDTARNASHIYTRPGFYPITHIVTSCHGCSDTIVRYSINAKGPVVTIHADKKGGCPCTPITLFISSYDTDTLLIYSGNGTVLFTYLPITRGTAANPHFDTVTFTYCGIGDNNPIVSGVDAFNCVQAYQLEDTLVIDTPSIAFSHVIVGCGTDSVCFNDLTTYFSRHTRTVQRAWDFGDGSPADSTLSPCHKYATPGDYTVSLFIKDTWGCFNTLTYALHINAPPQAVISLDDTIGCVPLLIHMRDSSVIDDSTSIVSGFWDFGDGASISTFTDTSHVYTIASAPGSYTVTLVIRDGYGCTDTARRQVEVRPTATVTAGPDQMICLGNIATLSASGTPPLVWFPSYNIDTTVPSAPIVFPRADTTYYVRGGDLPRCYVYDSVRVRVSIITADDTATGLCLGQTTVFSATASSTYATISSYFWRFGDGATGAGPTVMHVYPSYGTYIDSMIVTNSLGCHDTVYSTIVIGDKPHAGLSISDLSTCLGVPITVANTSTPGTSAALAGYTIDMQPDGVADYTTSPVSHVYPSVGGYTATLIQLDINGCADTATQNIVVHSNPKAIFNADSNCILLPNKLIGNVLIGDGGIMHYNWNINGVPQTGSDSATIVRAFATPGIYTICLSVADVYGCQSPDSCNLLNIISQPTDTIDPLDTTLCLGYSAAFHLRGRFSNVQWVPSTWLDNPTGTDVIATPRQPIKYLVYANYGHCNPKIDTVSIYVIDSVPVEATANPENIILGLSSDVTSTVKGTIDSIVWDPSATLSCRNCRNPIATPVTTTTYTATIYYSRNGYVCSNRASVTVTVITSCDGSLIYVPNTFTPNNDGTNDVFRLRGQGITRINSFRVYDRWGKVVYQAINTDDVEDAAWNGGLNNDAAKPENSGVFVYNFEIQCITGQVITGKGNVTLIR